MKLPAGLFAPYNAQATLHMHGALWTLLLPVTVHGRVSDIWRSYCVWTKHGGLAVLPGPLPACCLLQSARRSCGTWACDSPSRRRSSSRRVELWSPPLRRPLTLTPCPAPQIRNAHNYIRDLDAETDLYMRSSQVGMRGGGMLGGLGAPGDDLFPPCCSSSSSWTSGTAARRHFPGAWRS